MISLFSTFPISLLLLCTPSSSTFSWGPCPSIFSTSEEVISLKAQGFFYSFSDLSPSDFLGTWLDVYRSQDFPYAKGNCTQGFYYITEDGKIAAKNSEIVNGVNSSATAEVFIDPDTSGQLYVKFSHFGPAGDFKIIHTDYKNSALVFSCTSVLLAHMKFAWILVRRLDVEPPGLYYQLIERFGISLDRMINTNHVNC